MVAACGEAMSVEGTKRTNLIAAATSAFDPESHDPARPARFLSFFGVTRD